MPEIKLKVSRQDWNLGVWDGWGVDYEQDGNKWGVSACVEHPWGMHSLTTGGCGAGVFQDAVKGQSEAHILGFMLYTIGDRKERKWQDRDMVRSVIQLLNSGGRVKGYGRRKRLPV